MDYLVDTLTRAPSQVLVKSATSFGEEAAKIFGAILEESLKNCTDDITTTIKESASASTKKLGTVLEKFGGAFKETGVEGFTEWGIAIERAFLHVGSKVESGLSNSSSRLAASISNGLHETSTSLHTTIKESVKEATERLGVEQVKETQKIFRVEISLIVACIVLVSIGAFLYFISNSIHNGLSSWIFAELKTISFIIFALLNGYALYTWNRAISNQPKDEKEPIDNPRILFFVIGGISFFAGNLCHEILYFSYFNLGLSFIVMIAITLITYRVFSFNIAYRAYAMYRLFNEFIEWKRARVDPLKVSQMSPPTSAPVSAPVSARSPRREATKTTSPSVSQTASPREGRSPRNTPRRKSLTIPIPSPTGDSNEIGVQSGAPHAVSPPKRSPKYYAQLKTKETLFPSSYSDSDTTDDDDSSGDEVEKISPRVIAASSVERSPLPRRRTDISEKQLFGDPNVMSDEEELLRARKTIVSAVQASSPVVQAPKSAPTTPQEQEYPLKDNVT